MKTYCDFFDWCVAQELTTHRQIANALGVTTQTVRNWRDKKDCDFPPYLRLAVKGYQVVSAAPVGMMPPSLTHEWFTAWRMKNGLTTLHKTGEAFGLSRQAVHHWERRQSLPHWLSLACIGFETEGQTGQAESQE